MWPDGKLIDIDSGLECAAWAPQAEKRLTDEPSYNFRLLDIKMFSYLHPRKEDKPLLTMRVSGMDEVDVAPD